MKLLKFMPGLEKLNCNERKVVEDIFFATYPNGEAPDDINEIEADADPVNTKASDLAKIAVDGGYFEVEEAAAFLRLKVSTMYSLVHQRRIPSRKHGGRLIFLKAQLIAWSNAQETKAVEELTIGLNELKALSSLAEPVCSLSISRNVESKSSSRKRGKNGN